MLMMSTEMLTGAGTVKLELQMDWLDPRLDWRNLREEQNLNSIPLQVYRTYRSIEEANDTLRKENYRALFSQRMLRDQSSIGKEKGWVNSRPRSCNRGFNASSLTFRRMLKKVTCLLGRETEMRKIVKT